MIQYHTNQRLCDLCRHFFPKSKLKISRKGQFCKECYEKYHEIRI